MAVPRLFLDAQLAPGAALSLDQERSHYLCRVLRLRAQADVELFNGDGTACRARIEHADPRRCRVLLTGPETVQDEPRCRLHLAVALLKGDRQDWVLQKATELGTTDIWLLETERSEARIRDDRRANRLNHWQRVIQSTCEQCGRLRLPALHPPGPLESIWSGLGPDTLVYCFQPGAPVFDPPAAVGDTALVIGPEGGFSAVELADVAQRGAVLAGLGDLILRADTAPVAALSLVRQVWSWAAP